MIKGIKTKATAIFTVAVLFANIAYGAQGTLKQYQARTKADINKIGASSKSILTKKNIVTAAVAAGSIAALWAVNVRMVKAAAAKKMQQQNAVLDGVMRSRDEIINMSNAKDAKIRALQKSAAEKKGLLSEKSALNITCKGLDGTEQASLLQGAAYIYAYRIRNQELLKYFKAGGPERIYANIETYELKNNIRALALNKQYVPLMRSLRELLKTLPADNAPIPASYYAAKAALYKKLPRVPGIKMWLEEKIVRENMPYLLSGTKDLKVFIEGVRTLEARGQSEIASKLIERSVSEEPALAKVLPRTFMRFGGVALLVAGAFAMNSFDASAAVRERVQRLRVNPALFVSADDETLRLAQKDKELTDSLILMSNSIHEIAAMPAPNRNKFLTSVLSAKKLIKGQVDVMYQQRADLSKFGNFKGF